MSSSGSFSDSFFSYTSSPSLAPAPPPSPSATELPPLGVGLATVHSGGPRSSGSSSSKRASSNASRKAPSLSAVLLSAVSILSSVGLNVTDIIGKFAFVGFNPEVTYAALLTSYKRSIGVATTTAEDIRVFFRDMSHLCIFIAVRGVNFSKGLKRMSKEGRDVLQPLVAKYNVKHGVPLNSMANDTVTGARIMGTFPGLVAAIYSEGHGSIIGDVPDDFPRFLCFSAGPALIPKAHGFDGLYESWKVWQNSFAAVIKSPQNETDYGKICRDSTLLSDDERLHILQSLFKKEREVIGRSTVSWADVVESAVQMRGRQSSLNINSMIDETISSLSSVAR